LVSAVKSLTDSDYADIERYCLALHPRLPNLDEWPDGWTRREPALMYVMRYRVWLVIVANPAKRKGREPKPFITWRREADRAADGRSGTRGETGSNGLARASRASQALPCDGCGIMSDHQQ
jgi:hypothetical protein